MWSDGRNYLTTCVTLTQMRGHIQPPLVCGGREIEGTHRTLNHRCMAAASCHTWGERKIYSALKVFELRKSPMHPT